MRPGQHNNNNKNRGRGRNRNRHGGGGGGGYNGGGGGGNPGNRVFESNGPDVKLRGTAQTIADKYMQLGRDAQSSGDTVMVESYYQHAEHYYRLWLANQPAGQPINFPRRVGDEEYEDENAADQADQDAGEGEEVMAAEGEGAEASEGSSDEGEAVEAGAEPRQDRQPRYNNNRDGNRDGNREGGRNNNRNRWPRRGDRNQEQGDRPPRSEVAADAPEAEAVVERVERAPVAAVEASGDWEAPSFLRRPMPAVADGDEEPVVERRPRGRRPKFGEDMPAPVEAVADDQD